MSIIEFLGEYYYLIILGFIVFAPFLFMIYCTIEIKIDNLINAAAEKRIQPKLAALQAEYSEKEQVLEKEQKALQHEKDSLYYAAQRDLKARREKLQADFDAKWRTLEKAQYDSLSARNAKLKDEVDRLSEGKKFFEEALDHMREDTFDSPWLAGQIADLEYLRDSRTSQYLRYKTRPALKAANEVAAIAKDKREWVARAKALEYQLKFYEALDPALSDMAEYSPEEVTTALVSEQEDNQDSVRRFLSQEEYARLSDLEKSQLALDRWRTRNRSKWELGRDFERYVGYLYEKAGYTVSYFGALEGKMDLGRDLIARKKKEIIIIQCKRWSANKTIHEKHVFQLFGSIMAYETEHPGTSPQGLLITTCPLSDVAKNYADRLKIKYQENYPAEGMDTYPLIKCNIGNSGEKIFHLPFDQQYDRVNITESAGDFYAATVQEATAAGFRRAYRWQGT